MKKLLLFVAALFIAAGANAQVTGCDVYSFGVNPDGNQNTVYGGLYKNNSLIKYFSPNGSSTYVIHPAAMVPYGSDDFAMAYNRLSKNDDRSWHDMYVKDRSENIIMDMPADSWTYFVNDVDYYNDTVYSVATIDASSIYNAKLGVLMKNDTPIQMFIAGETSGSSTYYRNTNAYAIEIDPEGGIYIGLYSYRHKGDDNYADGWWGRVEKLVRSGSTYNKTFCTLPDSYSIINDMEFYNGYLYVCGCIYNPDTDTRKAVMWRISGTTATAQVIESGSSNAMKIKVDGGYCYVTGWSGSSIKLWRFAIDQGMATISTYKTISTPSGKFNSTALDVNSTGVYNGGFVAGNSSFTVEDALGKVWKDGQELFDLSTLGTNNKCSSVKAIVAKEIFDTPTARTLPYSENFEMGNTDWRNWIKIDGDENNGLYATYWERYVCGGKSCVRHQFNGVKEQNGNIYSPKIQLPNNPGQKITLRLKTYEGYPSYISNGYSRIYVAKNITNFTETDIYASFDKVWEQTSSGASSNWKDVEIDLTAYKGQVISINFDYGGENAHSWAVTDLEIFEEADGIEEEGESIALSVMPNPANDVIRVNGLNGMEEVCVYNTLGQVVKTARLNDGESLTISDLSAGVYMLRSENNAKVVKFTVK